MEPHHPRHCERSEAIHSSFARRDGLLRGACHRAAIRPTRWLAMTWGQIAKSRFAHRPHPMAELLPSKTKAAAQSCTGGTMIRSASALFVIALSLLWPADNASAQ